MKRFGTPGRARFSAVAVIAGAFACLAGGGYAAGLVHFTHSSATSAQYPPSKVTICHHTHSQHNPFVTITVSQHALPAHLGHGDTIGACSAQQQGSTETQVQTEAPQHGPSAHQDRGRHNGKAHAGKASKPGKSGGDNGHGNQGHGPNAVHGKGHGKGSGHGQGQGHGQGHGNSGGGKGNDHKP